MSLEPDDEDALLQARLDALFKRAGVTPERFEHPPLHTVEEARPYWAAIPGRHTKNLFLRDAGGSAFLVTLPAEMLVDMKTLAPAIGARRLSFGSPERLMQALGTRPGAVGPLSLINDPDHVVRFCLERGLAEADRITCHPLRNTATLSFSRTALQRLMAVLGVVPLVFDLPG